MREKKSDRTGQESFLAIPEAEKPRRSWKWITALLFVFLCMSKAGAASAASYQVIESSGKVNGITFSYERNYDSGDSFLYAEKKGEKKLLVSDRGLNYVILTNGSAVLYSTGRSGKEIVYQISVNGKNKKKLFSVKNVADGFQLVGYCSGKVYYTIGLDPGRLYSCTLKTGKKKFLKEGVTAGDQYGSYIILRPIEGAGGQPLYLHILNAKTGKIRVISKKLLPFEYVYTGKYIYYVECEFLRPQGLKLWVKRCLPNGTKKKTIVKPFKAQYVKKFTKNSITYVNTKGKTKKKKF